MGTAIHSKKFGPTALRRINYCRMYLNVLLLSDITTPNGQHIDEAASMGNQDDFHRFETYDRVHQPKPNDKAWTKWRKCLNLLCNNSYHHTLKTPLGAWTVRPHDCAKDWESLYSPEEDVIYHSDAMGYSIH